MLDPSQQIAELIEKDCRYRLDAYAFVFEALNYAQQELRMGREVPSEPIPTEKGGAEETGPQKHVTGQELCKAIREYALRQYGYMAKTVLNTWGIQSTNDIGEIVFNLIKIGQMRKTPEDHREDFNDLYDFETTFQQEFKITPPE
jgi:uncharacterized repeat protein (TIGR04138 family)